MITLSTLQKMKAEQKKIAMLTCYEASFATLLDNAGVDILLVGDSLGMTVQGHNSTLPVTLEHMCYHTQAVARGAKNALVLADLSFGSYQQGKKQAFDSASKLMAAGAHMVKLEGGSYMVETTSFLQERGIPVCAHLGLTPQSVNAFGGYKVQGKTDVAARQLLADAQAHEQAGASMILLECVPAEVAKEITNSLHCPVIGIGAGIHCDGQVLVLHDALGIYAGKSPKFSKDFMQNQPSIQSAIVAYVKEVKEKSFPTLAHSF